MTRYAWAIPIQIGGAGTSFATALTSDTTNALQNLRSLWAGSGAPSDSDSVARMLYVDETTGSVMQVQSVTPSRTDVALGAVCSRWDWHEAVVEINGISATTTFPIWTPPANAKALALAIQSDTATSGSSGANRWTFQVTNATGSVNLLATAFGTDGTGGGAELAVNTTRVATFDQNTTPALNDYLSVVVTKTGTPTALTTARLRLTLRAYMRGA